MCEVELTDKTLPVCVKGKVLYFTLVMRDKIATIFTITVPQGYVAMYPQSLIDILTFFWIPYAILMVLRFSDDVITSVRIREYLGRLAVAFFLTGLAFVAVGIITPLLIAYVAYFYPASIVFLVVFAAILAVVYFVLRKYHLKLIIEPRQE